jgi:hypothetical protein
MSDAGMTVIRAEGLLGDSDVRWLEGLPKLERAVEVGKLSRERVGPGGGKTLSKAITEGISMRVEGMLLANGIDRSRIVSVKRDAVFVSGPPPSVLSFADGTAFRVKGSHTCYVRLGRVELYCTPSRRRWTLKGVADDRMGLHGPYSVELAMDVLRLLEAGSPAEAAATICQFRRDYVARRLPLGFYREMNGRSSFCVRAGRMRFLVDEVDDGFPRDTLEITHNVRTVIVPLVQAL